MQTTPVIIRATPNTIHLESKYGPAATVSPGTAACGACWLSERERERRRQKLREAKGRQREAKGRQKGGKS